MHIDGVIIVNEPQRQHRAESRGYWPSSGPVKLLTMYGVEVKNQSASTTLYPRGIYGKDVQNLIYTVRASPVSIWTAVWSPIMISDMRIRIRQMKKP